MIVSGYLLVPDSSKILLDGRFRPVYFALKAQMEAFYHIARAGIVEEERVSVRMFCVEESC